MFIIIIVLFVNYLTISKLLLLLLLVSVMIV